MEGKEFSAITNIGTCPTFGESAHNDEPVVEVHIIDFNESIYGKDLEVQFLYKLREETRFENAEELKLQLERDKMRFINRASEKVLAE